MKIILAILVLIFSLQSYTKADDISEFEIEGMSIGDSLLDYFSEDQLNKAYPYKNKKYATISKALSNYEIYSGFQVHVRSDDKKYIIEAIEGMLLYENNIENCYKKQNEIIADLDKMFVNSKKNLMEKPHSADPKSFVKAKEYTLKAGDFIRVVCVDWSKEIKFIDKLKVALVSKELMNWINNKAYE